MALVELRFAAWNKMMEQSDKIHGQVQINK